MISVRDLERRLPPARAYRLAVTVAVGTVILLLFGIGALGIIGDGGRSDRIYLAVLAVLVIGTAVAGLRPPGMARALLATALTQVLVGAVALLAGLHRAEDASVLDIVGLTLMYAGLFGLSAWLFLRASERASTLVGGVR